MCECSCGDVREVLILARQGVAKLEHQHRMLHCLSAALADIAGKLMTPEETKALIAKLNAAKANIDAIATPPAP